MILFSILFIQNVFAMNLNPTPFPVFLKEGFSTILEFDEAPTQVVLGDQNLFQIEKLNRSIVLKPLVTYATTNMFVYFKGKNTRLFILTATEEAEPTYYRRFTELVAPAKGASVKSFSSQKYYRSAKVRQYIFDDKKDFLTLDIDISADSTETVRPDWSQVRLKYKSNFMKPSKLWSERREAQKDSKVKARFIFTKPNVPSGLREVFLVIPIKGSQRSFTVPISKRKS